MLRIKDKFWDLIKSGEKTIELRKVSKLKSLDFVNGRFEYAFLNEKSKILGSITCNGYSITLNPFKWDINDNRTYINDVHQVIIWKEKENSTIETFYPSMIFGKENTEWILENYGFLYNYFKDEKEILVLNIENFKEFKNE